MPYPPGLNTGRCVSVIAALLLFGCGASDNSNDHLNTLSANATVTPHAVTFNWNEIDAAAYYRVLHDPDGSSGFTDISGALPNTSFTAPLAAHLSDWENRRFMVEACNTRGCTTSAELYLTEQAASAIGYLKAEPVQAQAAFGFATAISADGATLAVSSPRFDNTELSANNSGVVFVFQATDTGWSLTQTLHNPALAQGAGDLFGYSLALSDDGTTLAIGAPYEDSATEDSAANARIPDSGAVYLYRNSDNGWQQHARLKASNAGKKHFFGVRVALSADGTRLAASAPYEDSNASGVNGDQNDHSVKLAGAVYVFQQTDQHWRQQAYIKPSTPSWPDSPCFDPRPPGIECHPATPSRFGYALAFADAGNLLAVGSPGDNSGSGGVNGNEKDFSARSSGAVHILRYHEASWRHTDYIKARQPGADDEFGLSLALSRAGNTLAVGAPYENGAGAGLHADASSLGESDSGAVYLFHYDGQLERDKRWQQQHYIKAEGNRRDNLFGWQVALSGEGDILAAGAPRDDSDARAISRDWHNSSAPSAGAAYVYQRSGQQWQLRNYIKANNSQANDTFGRSVALARDGQTLAVGATGEDGTGGNALDSGAVYLY